MAKKFSLNPFRRKKRTLWKKGHDEAAEAEEAQPETPELEFSEDVSEEEALVGAETPPPLESGDSLLEDEPLLEDALLEEPEEIQVEDQPAVAESGIDDAVLEDAPLLEPTVEETAAAADAGLLEEEPVSDRAPAAETAAPPAHDEGEELAKAFESAVTEEEGDFVKAAPVAAAETPAAELPQAEESPDLEAKGEEMRKVKDSVDSLTRRALTAGQLKQTIENAMESRIAGLRGSIEDRLKDTVTRVKDLFQEGAGKLGEVGKVMAGAGPTGEKIEELSTRLAELGQALGEVQKASATSLQELEGIRGQVAGLRTERESWGGEAKASIDEVGRNVQDLWGKVAERVQEIGEKLAALEGAKQAGDERLVQWLERLNVQAEKEARQATEDRDSLRELLRSMQRDHAEVGQLRSQLNRVRGNLSAGLQDVREEVWRSRIARSLLKSRIETALGPAETALSELDAVLRGLAEK